MLIKTITFLKPHQKRQIKEATLISKLWDLAATKQLLGRCEAIANLYKAGYTIEEIAEGLSTSGDKIRRAISKSGGSTRKNRGRYNLTPKEWEDKKAEYHQCCAYCGKKSTHLEVEHIIALSQGGEDTKANIVPACSRCNQSKNKRPLDKWQGFRGLQLNQDMV